jgi:hypothetical protein
VIRIATLKAAGLSDAQIVAVIEAAETERGATRREQNRINQKNSRARRQHVSADSADAPLTSPPQTSRSLSRGTRIPTDWEPSLEDWKFAVDMLGVERAKSEVPKFKDYWQALAGARATKRDWSATWRNWCRKAAERELPLLRTIEGGAHHGNRRRRGEGLGFGTRSAVSAAADGLIADAEKREREAGAFTIDGEFSRVESG